MPPPPVVVGKRDGPARGQSLIGKLGHERWLDDARESVRGRGKAPPSFERCPCRFGDRGHQSRAVCAFVSSLPFLRRASSKPRVVPKTLPTTRPRAGPENGPRARRRGTDGAGRSQRRKRNEKGECYITLHLLLRHMPRAPSRLSKTGPFLATPPLVLYFPGARRTSRLASKSE